MQQTWLELWISEHTCPGGRYDESKYLFNNIEDTYYDLSKKDKTYILYRNFNPVVSNTDDRYYHYERAFDFEAMLKQIKTTESAKILQIVSGHVPGSVSIFSNVPNDEKPIFYAMIYPIFLLMNLYKLHLKIIQKPKI